ncbi:hypothetical protein VTN00DRAFT_9866 [Thermoascus crustaceus]|uniref:uncharacterized protein n=1 Tax=Thermoascus crustaceus TaxID=5088 RepID=UPI003743344D
MQSSSRSDSHKAQKLDGDSFVAFEHAAAGHDGVRCDLSGSLIAKPCTPGEVAFYESSALHPRFREFMPTFIGTLSSADHQQPLALAAAERGGAIVIPQSDNSSATNTPISTDAPQQIPGTSEHASLPQQQEAPWVPSGGRKLDTGLSIVLENVASGFKRPNVLDVKLGARLWADDAHPSKRAKLDAVSKETTSSSLGFRIAGMKVWTGKGLPEKVSSPGPTDPYATKYEGSEGAKGEVIEKDGYKRYDKWYGRSFNASNVKEGFETFLAGAKAGKVDRSKLIAQRLAVELRRVQSVLEAEESRMYSSSVLIVYEGDAEALEHALEDEKKREEKEAETPEDEDDEEETFEFQQDGLKILDFKVGDGTIAQGTLKVDVNTETAQQDLEDEEEEPPKVHDLRLIDFAHASWTPGQGPDENVLMGVRNLARIMEELSSE